MKLYEVTIKETLIYKILVEAETEEQAENEAFNDKKFVNNLCDENDSEVTEVEELEEIEE